LVGGRRRPGHEMMVAPIQILDEPGNAHGLANCFGVRGF
jgi:hypothetical protein